MITARVGLDRILERKLQGAIDHLPTCNVFPVNKSDSNARVTCTACATNTVHIRLFVIRAFEVNNVSHVVNVNAASSNIGTDQDVDFSIAESAKCLLASALAQVTMHAPAVPLIANVTAGPLTDPAQIRASLVAQVTGTVRWRECMAAMAASGVTLFVEIGAGKVLAGLVKRNVEGATGISIGTPDDITAALPQLKI